jgi:hypothetical protein
MNGRQPENGCGRTETVTMVYQFLPYNGGTYVQAPFEDITETEFNERVKLLHDIDLSKIVEETDENGSIR